MPIPASALRTLRERLRAAGLFERRELRTWLELTALLAVFAAATAGVAAFGLPVAILLVPVAAVALTSAAMLGHEGGHRALSKSRLRNELMLHLTFPLIGGMSARYWKHKHNVLHHGHPNVVPTDEDLELWPMASTRAHHERASRPVRWFQRHLQGWFFWPLTAFLTFSMRYASVRFLAAEARAGKVGAAWFADVGCMVLHVALWLVVPSLAFGFGAAVAFYLVLWGINGVLLSAIFVPAHVGLPVVSGFDDAWRLQLETTRDLAMPRWLAWLFMGLDRQVEHHLFPRLGHRELAHAAPIVRAWAAEHDLPHKTIGYGAGLLEVTRLMHRAWDLEVAPAPPSAPTPG